MKLLFFDLETTGTNPARNGIHQISGQIVIDGKKVEDFDFHVQPNPKAQIEEAALPLLQGIRPIQLHRKCLCLGKGAFKRPYRN